MADQKPVDSAQIVLDRKDGPSAGGTGTTAKAASGMGGLVFKVVAVLFVVGNVTALYVLHFVNRPSPTTRFSFSNFEAVSGTSASEGDVVSLSADSKLRNGAGTTAYLNRSMLNEKDISYYEYINVAKLGTSKSSYNTNLLSYRRVGSSGSKQSVLTTAIFNPTTKAVTVSELYDKTTNVVENDAIRDIATLSDSVALVLTVDDTGSMNPKSYVMPASISDKGATLWQGKRVPVTTGSATHYMTRLNSNNAIIAYYDPYIAGDYMQNVKIATVSSDGTVTVSTPKPFGPANDGVAFKFVTWGRPVTISSSEGSFAIPYYTKGSGLCLTMSTYSANTLGNFTTGVCNTNFKPAYYPEGVMLSDNIMLLAFHDESNVLTLVTAQVTATTAIFRSSFVFSEVAGKFDFGNQWGFSPDVSLALLSGNRVAVSFLNPTMNGRQSVKIVKYSTDSLAFKDVTPVIPVAAPGFALSINAGKPVTQRVIAVGTDSVVAVHLGIRGDTKFWQVALVESFGSPVGVIRDLNGKSKASVAISGKASDVHTSGKEKLVEGKLYFATTAGFVVSPAAGTSAGAEVFAVSENADILVTMDSKIGLATGKDELFVSTAL